MRTTRNAAALILLVGSVVNASPPPQPAGQQFGRTAAKAEATIGIPTEPSPAYIAALQTQRSQGASALWDAAHRAYLEGTTPLDRVIAASEKLRDADRDADGPGGRQPGDDRHIERLSNLVSKVLEPRFQAGRGSILDLSEGRLALTEAMIRKARGGWPASKPVRGAGDALEAIDEDVRLRNSLRFHYRGLDQDPRTVVVLKQLERPIKIPFDADTPLEEVLNHLREVTADEKVLTNGIPIYVDEVGMQRGSMNVTPASTIKLSVAGIPLHTSLRLMLRQLGLAYIVKEGVLIISSPEGLVEEIEHAGRGEVEP